MRKVALKLIIAAMLAPVALPTAVSAETEPSTWTTVNNGKIENDRMLIPLRAVSEIFDAKVTWNQKDKSITIRRGDRELRLQADSRTVLVDGASFIIDVPARIDNGVTYVPARFMNQAFGGMIEWISQTREARVYLGNKRAVIRTEEFKPVLLSKPEVEALIQKLNEAVDISKYAQVRAHFSPYFTDAFISKMIRQKGIPNNMPSNEPAYVSYFTNTTGLLQQFSTVSVGYELEHVDRYVNLVYVDQKWKVDDVFVARKMYIP